MSVTPALPVLSNPWIVLWPITLIVIVVVIAVPSAMLSPTFSSVAALVALVLGRHPAPSSR